MRSIIWIRTQGVRMESALGGMESSGTDVCNQDRRDTKKYNLTVDAMRGQAAMPYNALALIPY